MGIDMMSPPLRNLKCFSPVMCQCKVICSKRTLSLMFGCKVSWEPVERFVLIPVFFFACDGVLRWRDDGEEFVIHCEITARGAAMKNGACRRLLLK